MPRPVKVFTELPAAEVNGVTTLVVLTAQVVGLMLPSAAKLAARAQRIAHAVRSHGRIESSTHWMLDMAFGEDHRRVRTDNAVENLAILRRIALNLLRACNQEPPIQDHYQRSYRALILGLVALI